MLTSTRRCATIRFIALTLGAAIAQPLSAQPRVTTPQEAFGAGFGDDDLLASYQQISSYWRTLEMQSKRIEPASVRCRPAGMARRVGDQNTTIRRSWISCPPP